MGVKVRRSEDQIIAEAASLKVKALVFGVILIPKAFIAIVLWWLGCCWLTATNSFESLVLNAAALAFVTNMDEMFYLALTSVEVKEETVRTQIRLPVATTENPINIRNQGILLMLFWTLV